MVDVMITMVRTYVGVMETDRDFTGDYIRRSQ